MAASYTAKDITVLEGLEPVRKRPGMYIGDTSERGLHHLVTEIVDNSVDEALAGFCTEINVVILNDDRISVEDNGRGIPVDMHPTEKRSALEVVHTVLHAGGKFEKSAYKVSGGLHGVGASVVNALSDEFEVEVHKNGKIYFQRYERGIPKMKVEERGATNSKGTKTTFTPDSKIFPEIKFKYEIIARYLREMAYLNAGLRIRLRDERINKAEEFHYEGGIAEYVATLSKSKYLWLYSAENVPEKSRERFNMLKGAHLKTARAWALKEALRELWRQGVPNGVQFIMEAGRS